MHGSVRSRARVCALAHLLEFKGSAAARAATRPSPPLLSGVRADKVKAAQAAAAAKKSERPPLLAPPRTPAARAPPKCTAPSRPRARHMPARSLCAPAHNLGSPRLANLGPPRLAADKKTLNLGKSGLSAGLDDYVYDSAAGPDDEYDFM